MSILSGNFLYRRIKRRRNEKGQWIGLSKQVWKLIATQIRKSCSNNKNIDVATDATHVATIFSEGLLRSILSLKPCRQFELVQDLADGNITKGKFKTRAHAYRCREAVFWHCRRQLGKTKFKWRLFD